MKISDTKETLLVTNADLSRSSFTDSVRWLSSDQLAKAGAAKYIFRASGEISRLRILIFSESP